MAAACQRTLTGEMGAASSCSSANRKRGKVVRIIGVMLNMNACRFYNHIRLYSLGLSETQAGKYHAGPAQLLRMQTRT